MRIRFSWRPSDALMPWFVGTLFLASGLFMGWWLPGWADSLDARLLADGGPDVLRTPIFRTLGVTFSALGAAIIGLAVHARPRAGDDASARIRRARLASYRGGVLGALAFGVPATLVLPAWTILYLRNPRLAIPPDWEGSTLGFALLCGAFTTLGLITLVGLLVVGRDPSEDAPDRSP